MSNIAKLTEQFILTHSYFSGVWEELHFSEKKKVIDIIVSGKGIIPSVVVMSTKYIYDGRFKGNILVVGRTECGETPFVQKLALYDFFGKLKTAKWISGIRLNSSREAEIESNFSCEVSFFYPNEINELGDLLEEFKLEVETEETTNDDSVNIFGEVIDRDRLIFFDDVSGLADNSNKFASFLTVARKYKYNCVYIFHTIYPEKAIWRTILSQTNIFNIFPDSVPLSAAKRILDGVCVRKTTKYIPRTSLWINRLFIELANKNEKVCLTLNCSNTNRDSPSRFRSEADNPDKQVCYFNTPTDEEIYNEFIARRIKSKELKEEIQFEITEVKSKTNKSVIFDVTNKIEELVKENDTSRGGLSEAFKFRTGQTFTGGRIGKSNRDSKNYSFSIREDNVRTSERAKPRYLLGR